jgi:hypothetical protein
VGKPLRQYATWNVERDEASIPNKQAAIMILEGLLGDGTNLQNSDSVSLVDNDADILLRLENNIRRRLERMREPQVYHSIEPVVETRYPDIEKQSNLPVADVEMRIDRRISFNKELMKRIAKKISDGKLDPLNSPMPCVPGKHNGPANVSPRHFCGKPLNQPEVCVKPDVPAKQESPLSPELPIPLGDSLASKARKLAKKRAKDEKA